MLTSCLDVVVEWPMTSGKEIWSWKHSESSSLLVQKYAAALMRVTVVGFLGVTGETDFGSSGSGSKKFGKGANNGNVLAEAEISDSCCDSCQKKMLPNTQSIEGL